MTTSINRLTHLVRTQFLGLLALLIVLTGGTALAADAAKTAAKNTVTSKSIKNGQVRTIDLAPGAVTGDRLAPDAVGTDQVKNGTLTGADVSDNSLTGTDVNESTPRHRAERRLARRRTRRVVPARDRGAEGVGRRRRHRPR